MTGWNPVGRQADLRYLPMRAGPQPRHLENERPDYAHDENTCEKESSNRQDR